MFGIGIAAYLKIKIHTRFTGFPKGQEIGKRREKKTFFSRSGIGSGTHSIGNLGLSWLGIFVSYFAETGLCLCYHEIF